MQNKVFGELPPGNVRPAGILLAYCKAQAEHISREAALYDDFSPSSAWLGGSGESVTARLIPTAASRLKISVFPQGETPEPTLTSSPQFVKEGDSLAKPPASVVAELLAAAGPLATFKAVRYILKAERFAHSLELPVAKLVFLAVDESRRGEGLGVKALGYFLAEENFVLETHDGSKAAYYLRHGGRLVAEYDLTKSLKHSIIIFEKSLLSAEEK